MASRDLDRIQRLDELSGARLLGNKGKAAVVLDDLNGLLQLPDKLSLDAIAYSDNPAVVNATSQSSATVNSTSWTDINLSASITIEGGGVEIDADIPCWLNSGTAVEAYIGLRLLRGATVIFDPSESNGTGPFLFGLFNSPVPFGLYSVLRFPRYFDSAPGAGTFTYKLQARLYAVGSGQTAEFMVAGGTTTATGSMTLRSGAAIDAATAVVKDVKLIHTRLLAIVAAMRTRRGR